MVWSARPSPSGHDAERRWRGWRALAPGPPLTRTTSRRHLVEHHRLPHFVEQGFRRDAERARHVVGALGSWTQPPTLQQANESLGLSCMERQLRLRPFAAAPFVLQASHNIRRIATSRVTIIIVIVVTCCA